VGAWRRGGLEGMEEPRTLVRGETESACAVRLAACAGASAPQQEQALILEPASRRLQSAEGLEAWGLGGLEGAGAPHVSAGRSGLRRLGSWDVGLADDASAPVREKTLILATGEPPTSVGGGRGGVGAWGLGGSRSPAR